MMRTAKQRTQQGFGSSTPKFFSEAILYSQFRSKSLQTMFQHSPYSARRNCVPVLYAAHRGTSSPSCPSIHDSVFAMQCARKNCVPVLYAAHRGTNSPSCQSIRPSIQHRTAYTIRSWPNLAQGRGRFRECCSLTEVIIHQTQ
jgi:hypothetical protein